MIIPGKITNAALFRGVAVGLFFLAVCVMWELGVSIINFERYQATFAWMSADAIFWRYCISVVGRELFIVGVILALLSKDFGRKMVILMSAITILSLPWKHPYQAFVNINLYSGTNSPEFAWALPVPWSKGDLYYPAMVMRMIYYWIKDFFVCAMTIVVLCWPRVRAFYR